MPRFLRFAAALLVAGVPQSQSLPDKGPDPPRTEDARAILTVDKPQFFLGENVLIHFCLENVSKAPFGVDYGGDYRGGSRHSRFKVTVVDEAGTAVPDPDPLALNLGGLGSWQTLAPGDRWCSSIPLTRYARIDGPGRYVVRAHYDHGWKTTRPPEGEVAIELLMPTPDEADRVVAAMLTLPVGEGVMGRVSQPYQDFSATRYPIYLPELTRLANAGSRPVVAGIGSIPTPEATRVLIDLLSHADRVIALDSSRWLAMRLPDSSSDEGYKPTSRGKEADEAANYLRDRGWRDDMAAPIRDTARRWLDSNGPLDVIEAANMLRAVGNGDDRAALTAAMDRALDRSVSARLEPDPFKRPPDPLPSLQRTAKVLIARSGTQPGKPTTAGEALMWLVAFERGARPEGWVDVLHDQLTHQLVYVREFSLRLVPAEGPVRLFDTVGTSLQSPDEREQSAAIYLVGRARLVEHLPTLEATVKTDTNVHRVDSMAGAMMSLGARMRVLDIAAERVKEAAMAQTMLRYLYECLEPTSGYSSKGEITETERKALAARWKLFISEHRGDIEAGKRFSFDDPAVTPDLVPSGMTFFRNGKPPWPKR